MNVGCFIRENEEKNHCSQKFYSIPFGVCYNVTCQKTKSFAGMKTGKAGFPITALLKMEVKKMIIKKMSALILAGVLTCTTPAMVFADATTDAVVDQAVEILEQSGVGDVLSDPDRVVDIIISAKDAIGQADVSDEEIASAINTAASAAGITLSESETNTLVSLYNKFKNIDINEEGLRSSVNKVYDKLESLGITKEDVKGVFGKLVDLVKSIFN